MIAPPPNTDDIRVSNMHQAIVSEQFKVIEHDGHKFEVSSIGRVRRSGAGGDNELTYGHNHDGYRATSRGKKNYLVHRLVAMAFVSNPESKPHINHKNGVRDDNQVGNLEWCTHAENMRHSFEAGLHKNITPVVGIPINGGVGYYLPRMSHARKIGAWPGNICTSANGNGTAKGCRWVRI